MLRAAVVRSQPILSGASRPASQAQWLLLSRVGALTRGRYQRYFADEKRPGAVNMPGAPKAGVPEVPNQTQSPTPMTPSSTTSIPPENVPKTPLVPEKQQTSPATPVSPPSGPPSGTSTSPTTAPSPPPPPPPPKKRRRFRTYFYLLVFLLTSGYAGGIYASLVSDSFHDFFTEYIPFGEEAVLFFEEREFKKRFSGGQGGQNRLYPQTSGENKVTFSSKSGASARTTQQENTTASASTQKGPESSASDAVGPIDKASKRVSDAKDTAKKTAADVGDKAKTKAKSAAEKAKEKAPDTVKKEESKPAEAKSAEEKPADAKSETPSKEEATMLTSAASTVIAPIEALKVPNADEPLVQEMAKILNDIIAVVNADNASKYSNTMAKAKDDVEQLARDLYTYRTSADKAADEKIRQLESQFDEAAKQLLARVQQEQREQEVRWREEYEAERERLSQGYDDKLRSEIEAAQQVSEQKLRNELLQQDIRLNDNFSTTIRDQVEQEREGRLSKLNELSAAVSGLDDLTGKWGEVVNANLQTQHLMVAVEAVRSVVESADRPTPFVNELVALKEVAGSDAEMVDAAIGSIHPSTYQNGIFSSAQLIDRFRRVAGEVRKAALLPENAGVASHAASFLLSRLLFKKQGLAVGDDVESILTRTETLLEEGNLDAAAREMNSLTGWARMLSQDWLGECRKVLEVRQALDVIATEARLRSLLVE